MASRHGFPLRGRADPHADPFVPPGAKPVTWGGGYALVMPHTARNKEGAWRLIQYLCSKPVQTQLEEGRRELKLSAGRLYLPKSVANRTVFESLVAKYVDGNPEIPPAFQRAYKVVKEMMPETMYRPVTPVGQVLWNQHITAYDDGVHHAYREQARQKLGPNAVADEVENRGDASVAGERAERRSAENARRDSSTPLARGAHR